MERHGYQGDTPFGQIHQGPGDQWPRQDETTRAPQQIETEVMPADEHVFYNQTDGSLPNNDLAEQPGPFPVPLFGAGIVNTDFQPFAGGPASTDIPALDFNGYILHAAPKPVPEELQREATGASIAEPDAILDEENGRTYHNYHDGRYYLPNDPVREPGTWWCLAA